MTNPAMTNPAMTDPRAALEGAFATIYGITKLTPDDWDALHWSKADRFRRFLDAEAWTDAALMLVQGPAEYPDSKTFLIDCAMQTSVYSQPVAYVWDERGKHMGIGRTPALALAAACLKAKEAGDGR